ncbi:hypothetical protein [Bradyrhizobium liaoningense]|uniref:hypothetical protein n=1 Tax=Bradyrhizobium liaoningense TaxID=43992 RepID=UPI001BA76799|nr:hypothetical protein [Bradyrhizobium liaoningense]
MNASCGLQTALRYLDQPTFARFKPRYWLISIALLPKVDSAITAGAGYNGRSSSIGAPYSTSWVIGSPPGLAVNATGERNSAITFKINSGDLIKEIRLDCSDTSPTFNALTNNLGLYDWLVRSASALNVNPSANADSPSYNTQITIRFNGDGSYSYAFPFGGAFVAASGSYSIDEQLQISMTPIDPPPKPYTVRTLPVADINSNVRNAAAISATVANQRLDLQQLQNTLRSLKAVQ